MDLLLPASTLVRRCCFWWCLVIFVFHLACVTHCFGKAPAVIFCLKCGNCCRFRRKWESFNREEGHLGSWPCGREELTYWQIRWREGKVSWVSKKPSGAWPKSKKKVEGDRYLRQRDGLCSLFCLQRSLWCSWISTSHGHTFPLVECLQSQVHLQISSGTAFCFDFDIRFVSRGCIIYCWLSCRRGVHQRCTFLRT